jgi:predicted nucleic acid-binding protein
VTLPIADGERIAIDTSVLVFYLDGTERTSPVCRWILDDLIGTGRSDGVVSTVTVAEALQRPIRRGRSHVRQVTDLLESLDALQVRSADLLVAAEAAPIRTETGIPLPDALVIATAVLTSSHVLVTNDPGMMAAADRAVRELRVVLLSEVSAV